MTNASWWSGAHRLPRFNCAVITGGPPPSQQARRTPGAQRTQVPGHAPQGLARGRRPPKAASPPAVPDPGGARDVTSPSRQPPYLLQARPPEPGPPRESARAGHPRRAPAGAEPGPPVPSISHCCCLRPRAPPSAASIQRLAVACTPPPVLDGAELRHRQCLA
ncbi:hypothetical protein NDU88_004577 [Pleurodeles waltl]|uniref:Uncharacterized protein n=1 Tax=Pleurodeles waltl TaxID=8319 RepID=A0AAV7MVV1_PLEWA|nr:hypothetical protein NDU88_004577 [Pleurodeles waltl]